MELKYSLNKDSSTFKVKSYHWGVRLHFGASVRSELSSSGSSCSSSSLILLDLIILNIPGVWVIINGVWIGHWIYWTYTHNTLLQVTIPLSIIDTICSSLQHVQSLLRLLHLHRLSPDNDCQCRSFRVQVLTSQRLSHNSLFAPTNSQTGRTSHTKLLLFYLPSQDCLVIVAASRFIASAQTAQKTRHPTVLLLHYVVIARTSQITPLPSYYILACYESFATIT
jgi:hypothetical protein